MHVPGTPGMLGQKYMCILRTNWVIGQSQDLPIYVPGTPGMFG